MVCQLVQVELATVHGYIVPQCVFTCFNCLLYAESGTMAWWFSSERDGHGTWISRRTCASDGKSFFVTRVERSLANLGPKK